MEPRVDARHRKPRADFAAFRQHYEPLRQPRAHGEVQAPLREQARQGALPVAEGQAYRQDLPAGARPHSRGIPRPVRLQIHDAELHAHILRVPRRRGRVRARAHFARRQARQPRGDMGDEPSAVVPDLLGDDENRRGARDGQHRLQNPRGRVPAAPVRHAHARHDQGLPRFALRRDYERALPRAGDRDARQAARLPPPAIPAQHNHRGLPHEGLPHVGRGRLSRAHDAA